VNVDLKDLFFLFDSKAVVFRILFLIYDYSTIHDFTSEKVLLFYFTSEEERKEERKRRDRGWGSLK